MTASKTFTKLLTLLIFICFTGIAYAQSTEHEKKSTTHGISGNNVFMINESNFTCFRDIDCLKNDRTIRDKVKINNNTGAEQYVLSGQSENENVHAVYDGKGKLIQSRLAYVNIPLPRAINQSLASGKYSEWRMIGNEKVVKNFNASTTEYKVILQKNDEGIVLYFDGDGNQKDQFFDGITSN